MCTTDYAQEEDRNGGSTVDSVALRVMSQHDGCKCELKLKNQKNTYTIYMRKYDLRTHAVPETTACGLAIDIDYNIPNNLPENKSPVECTEGTSSRSISLTTNGILHFRSRISSGNFSRGYCIQIYRHHSIENAVTLQLHCSQYLTTPPDKNITKYNVEESASEFQTAQLILVPEPCQDFAPQATIVDMCTTDFATEESTNGGIKTDSVALRVMTQQNGCTCEVSLQNQYNTHVIYMRRYDNLKSAGPEEEACGLAIQIVYTIPNNVPENKDSIECTKGINSRSFSLSKNGLLNLRSKIVGGNFSRGYCIQVYRHHTTGDNQRIQINCSLSNMQTTQQDKAVSSNMPTTQQDKTISSIIQTTQHMTDTEIKDDIVTSNLQTTEQMADAAIEDNTVSVAGDWNVVQDYDMDTLHYRSENNPQSKAKIHEVMHELDLLDIWRQQHPFDNRYSWRGPNHKQSRLDYFMITSDIEAFVVSSDIGISYRSDHSPVLINLKFSSKIRGKGTWKFNNSLLRETEFIEKVKGDIKTVIEEYESDPSIDIETEDKQFNISYQLLWDMIKMKVRGSAISFSSFQKKEGNKKEKDLLYKISLLDEKLLENNLPSVYQEREGMELELKILREKNVKGIITRAKARWQVEGEKGSNYFCNLEKKHYTEKIIPKLILEDETEITDPSSIRNEQKQFYKKLYTSCKPLLLETHRDTFLQHDNPFITKPNEEEVGSYTDSTLYIAIGVGSAVVIALIVLGTYIIIRRKGNNNKNGIEFQPDIDSNDDDSDGLKYNTLYHASEQQDIMEGNYHTVELEGKQNRPGIQNCDSDYSAVDGNYSCVDIVNMPLHEGSKSDSNIKSTPTTSPTSEIQRTEEETSNNLKHVTAGSNAEYAIVNKSSRTDQNIKHVTAPSDSNVEYAVVDKNKCINN
ncbi:Hypothetical predicted protein [Mytilus galloprovincialis]|nr:Hypothetical predicted protein [Mytilus galloprovincialis]